MPKKGDNIYKRKDGRWEARYTKGHTEAGKIIYGYVYAKTYRDVRTKLRMCISSVSDISDTSDSGILTLDGKKDAPFQDSAKSWLESIKPKAKESSYMKYSNMVYSYVIPSIGTVPLSQLTNASIENVCSSLLNNGGCRGEGLSPKTVASVLSIIRTIIKFTDSSGMIVKCDTKSIRIHQEMKEMRILTDSEHEKLCTFLCENPTPINLGILLCLFTGLRIGEICALRWEDISLADKTIHVHQTMQRIQDIDSNCKKTKIVITSPKSTCSVRIIPIPPDVARIILAQGESPSGFFLTNGEKNYVEPRVMQYHFSSVLKACSIAPANFHALRHTFATKCVELGFDVKTLSEILGHASVNITMNRYVHPTLGMKQTHMNRLSLPSAVKK